MATTEISTMASIQDKVKARIQDTFMDLLPDEMFHGLVQTELDRFTKVELPKLVQELARDRLKELILAEFKKPEWAETWDGNHNKASVLVSTIVKELAPELVVAMFGNMVQSTVNNMRNTGRMY